MRTDGGWFTTKHTKDTKFGRGIFNRESARRIAKGSLDRISRRFAFFAVKFPRDF